MSQVVLGSHRSVHAAYQASKEDICVSITSIYNKLNGIETETSAQLVRYAAGQVEPIIKKRNYNQKKATVWPDLSHWSDNIFSKN